MAKKYAKIEEEKIKTGAKKKKKIKKRKKGKKQARNKKMEMKKGLFETEKV